MRFCGVHASNSTTVLAVGWPQNVVYPLLENHSDEDVFPRFVSFYPYSLVTPSKG